MNIRKLLGCAPRLGDQISAALDYGVTFTGTVVEDNRKSDWRVPHYICDGTVSLDNMWKGVIEKEESGVFVPADRASLI